MNWFTEIVDLIKDGLNTYSDIIPLTELFFEENVDYSDEAKKILSTEESKKVLTIFNSKLATCHLPLATEIADEYIQAVEKETGFPKGKVLKPIRVAITGRMHGPALKSTIYLLGINKCLERLTKAISL